MDEREPQQKDGDHAMHDTPRSIRESDAAEAARRWRGSLPPQWRKSSTFWGLLVVGVCAGLYLGTFAGMFLLPTWWARLICLIVQPFTIGMLFVIGHDAAHNSLTPIGWLNRVLGRLVMLPAYHPYVSWAHNHNTLHHGGTNLKGKHPDFPPFSKEEFDRLPLWRRLLERLYRTPLGVGFYYVFDFYFGCLIFPRGSQRPPRSAAFHLERLLILAFAAGQVAAAYALTAYTPEMILPRAFYAGFSVTTAWTSWIWFMGFMSYVQHTHPRMAWYDDEDEWSFYHVQLKSSAHVRFPWPFERILNNIMDHPAHHLDPTIPLYNLPASQKLLEQVAEPHSVTYLWTPWNYYLTCSACKLYDYQRHCWTDFAGNPTTPCNLPAFPTSKDEGASCAAGHSEESLAAEAQPETDLGGAPAVRPPLQPLRQGAGRG